MDKNILDKFGDKIYELRKQKNISQDELAKIVGVSRQTVSKWEANVIQPKANKLQRICRAFNVGLEYFALKGETVEESCELNKNNNIAMSDVVMQSNEINKSSEQTADSDNQNQFLKKTNKKMLFMAIFFPVIFIIGIAMILFPLIFKAPKIDGSSGEIYSKTTWNFSIENIGWLLSIFSFIILFIMLIFTIYRKVKNKSKKR